MPEFTDLIEQYKNKAETELNFLEKLLKINNFNVTNAANDYNKLINTLTNYINKNNPDAFTPAIKEFLKDKPYIFMSLVNDDIELLWANYTVLKELGFNLKYIINQPDFFRHYIKYNFYNDGDENFDEVIKKLNDNNLKSHLNEELNTKLIIETINLSSKKTNELINAFNEYKLPYKIKEDLGIYLMAMNSCIDDYCDTVSDTIDEVNSCIELAQEHLKPLIKIYNFFEIFNIGQYFKKETDQIRYNKLLKKLLTKKKVNHEIIIKLGL